MSDDWVDEVEDEKFIELQRNPHNLDESLIRWTAMLIAQGYKKHEVRKKLADADLDRRLTQEAFNSLMSLADREADELQSFAVARAELDDVDWLRLDSFARRKRNMARLEGMILQGHALADNVAKLNNVAFMISGLMKAQDALDKMTGAQDAKPQVVVNIGYDPMQQFRQVVQEELNTIDITNSAVIESNNPEEEEEGTDEGTEEGPDKKSD